MAVYAKLFAVLVCKGSMLIRLHIEGNYILDACANASANISSEKPCEPPWASQAAQMTHMFGLLHCCCLVVTDFNSLDDLAQGQLGVSVDEQLSRLSSFLMFHNGLIWMFSQHIKQIGMKRPPFSGFCGAWIQILEYWRPQKGLQMYCRVQQCKGLEPQELPNWYDRRVY